jgi:signal transduction histidine kinase
MLTATLNHELKQPLTTIIAAVELSEKSYATGTENPSLHPDLIELIKTATEQADGILKKAHQPDLRSQEPIDWTNISETIKEQFMLLYGQRIQLDFVLQDISPLFQSDPVRIFQILTNLIRNSANALNGGPGTIRIVVSRGEDAMTINIEDTGPGFSTRTLGKQDGTSPNDRQVFSRPRAGSRYFSQANSELRR